MGVESLADGKSAAAALERMALAMKSRGPDEQRAIWHAGSGAGLVATRLSLVDVAHGSQPFPNEDRSLWGVLNGEIYNQREIRNSLHSKGHAFHSHSDTEILPHLYEEKGDQIFQELRGMYSLAVLDLPKQRLLLGRDHAGMKPLFYVQIGKGIIFASDVRALFASGVISPEADGEEIGKYFHLGYIPSPGTAFSRIHQVPPGTSLAWEVGEITIARHWFPPELNPIAAPEHFENLLQQAVQSHLQGDVEVGAYLSGGWDSSLIATFAKQHLPSLKTFSLVMPDHPRQDESRHSRAVAVVLGTDHYEIEFRGAMLPQLLMESAWELGEPFNAAPHGLLFLLAKLASAHVKTVVGGEGADELLGGYPWLQPDRAYRWRVYAPSGFSLLLASVMRNPARHAFLRKMACRSEDELDFEMIRRLPPRYFPEWVQASRSLDHRMIGYASVARQLGAAAIEGAQDHLQRRLLLEYGGRLTGAILPIGDRMSMARGLEVRLPFLDRGVVEFAMALPSRWKINGRQEKAILKPLVEKYVPMIAHRKKSGLRVSHSMLQADYYTAFAKEILISPSSCFSENEVVLAMDYAISPKDLLPSMLHFQLWWNAYLAPDAPARKLWACPLDPASGFEVEGI